MSPRSVRVVGLSKRFGRLLALREVGFELLEGQGVALIGPNGAGKSSLLRILAGASSPDAGSVEGLEAFSSAYVPDALEFPSSVTVLEWMAYAARLKGAASKRRDALSAAEEALAAVGLSESRDREASTLSRGMKQRLAFAQALLGEADLYLMDEPASALDPLWAIDWKEKIADLRSRGATILFSSHRIDEAVALSDRVLLFGAGRIVSDEPASAWRPSGAGFAAGFAERRFRNLVGGAA